jgi:outer membrane protein OmpA-like peptidoglycan-associated protein
LLEPFCRTFPAGFYRVLAQKPVKEHYTVSGGLLGAANLTKFTVIGNQNLDYKMKFGWGAGGWLNIPLGKAFSVEPQLIYNHYVYNSESIGALLDNGSANHLSVPILLKLDIGKNFAITAGPQFDFLMGIKDKEKCPTVEGLARYEGCPKINFNASAVQFVSGTCTLTTGSKAELNKLVKILNEAYPDVKIAIEGHTDNTGKAEKNQNLSECRANAVKSYLGSKKVAGDRLSAAGFGQEKPILTTLPKKEKRRTEGLNSM